MKITPVATLLATALLASSGTAQFQNLLANPSFENGLAGWSVFGPNIYAEAANPPAVQPRTGNGLCKMYGQFVGGFNVTGMYQAFPATPGQVYTLDCWTRHWGGDPLTGLGAPNDNWAVMKIVFFDANNIEVGNAERTILDGNQPTNTWIDNAPISGTAPTGTVRVEAFLLFLQPSTAGGSAQFDDVELYGPPAGAAYMGTQDDLVLSSALNGGFLTWGPGNDIKTAPAGSVLELNVSSPGRRYNLYGYVLMGQLFATGTPAPRQPGYPGLWFDFQNFFVLVNGLVTTPIGAPRIGPNGGTSAFYVLPPGFPPGVSVMVQALVIDASVPNTLYAASDAHELRL